MNLNPSKIERDKIKEKKEVMILSLLSQETYSTSEIVAKLLKKTRITAYRTLKKMEEDELVKLHQVGYEFRKSGQQTIWGLTPKGALLATDLDSQEFKIDYYEVGRVKPVTMAHSLALQSIRVSSVEYEWTDWISSRKLYQMAQKDRSTWLKIPDAFAVSPKGCKTAIELERTIKTPKRYEEILAEYAVMLSNKTVDEVLYICPDQKIAKRLERLFSQIKKMTINGKIFEVHETLLDRFKFLDYNNWLDD